MKPSEIAGSNARFSINKEKFHSLKDEAEKLQLYLETDRFTKESIETSKDELIKLNDQIQIETEHALTQLKMVKYMNPPKKLQKLLIGLIYKSQYLEGLAGTSHVWDISVPRIGFNGIKEDIDNTVKTIGDLLWQLQKRGIRKAESEVNQ